MKKALPYIVIAVLVVVIVCLVYQNGQLTKVIVAQNNSNSVDSYASADRQEISELMAPIGFKFRQQEQES